MGEEFNSKNYLIRNFSTTSFYRWTGIVSGLVLDALILSYFGFSTETDAFFTALAIPFVLSTTLEVQLPKVLIPIITNHIKKDGEEKFYHLLNNFINVSIIILLFVSLAGIFSANILISIQAPGFQLNVVRLSAKLSIILFWLVLFRGIGAILQSILYSYHKYLVASSSKVITNVVSLVVVVLLHGHIGIFSLALGYLLGSMVSLLIMIYETTSINYHYEITFELNNPELRRIFRLFVYPLLSHVLGESKVLLEAYFASFLSAGSLSALRYASKIVDSLLGVLLGSIVTTTLPLVSHYAAENNLRKMKHSVLESIKLTIFIATPVSLWLIFVSKPLLILLFARGEFSVDDAVLTGILIMLMTPYILLNRVSTIIQTIFYARMDTRTPVISSLITFIITTSVIIIFFRTIGIYVFPIASSVASLCTAVVMSSILHKKFGALGWTTLKDFAVRFSVVILITILGFVVGSNIGKHVDMETLLDKLLLFAIPSTLGVISFLATAILFHVIKFKTIYGYVNKK